MKHWSIGIILAVLAAALLYLSSAVALDAPTASWVLLGVFVLVVIAEFGVIARAVKAQGPQRETWRQASLGGTSARLPDPHSSHWDETVHGPRPWAGTAQTLGVMAVGLGGLLFYVFVYAGAQMGLMGWIIVPAVVLTLIWLGLVVLLTTGRV